MKVTISSGVDVERANWFVVERKSGVNVDRGIETDVVTIEEDGGVGVVDVDEGSGVDEVEVEWDCGVDVEGRNEVDVAHVERSSRVAVEGEREVDVVDVERGSGVAVKGVNEVDVVDVEGGSVFDIVALEEILFSSRVFITKKTATKRAISSTAKATSRIYFRVKKLNWGVKYSICFTNPETFIFKPLSDLLSILS